MIASFDDSSLPSSTLTPPPAAADAKVKTLRNSMSSISGTSAPSPDVDWLVAARRQQRVSPNPKSSKSPGGAEGVADAAGETFERGG